MAKRLFLAIKIFWQNLALCSLGFVTIIVVLILAVSCSPILLYRWVIRQVFAPLCRSDLGKAVTVASSATGTELGHDKGRSKPRCAILVNLVFTGPVKFERLTDLVHQNWIAGVDPTTEKLKYPEFQQYVESWMGYMFWKQDKYFKLENHLIHHKCEGSWAEMDYEKYACAMSEKLLNKPFLKRRSPWEMHMISNLKNSGMGCDGTEMTLLVFRFHHCMADGFGIFSALVEGLLKIPFSECGIATAAKPGSTMSQDKTNVSCFNQISFPIKIMRDVGMAAAITIMPVKTPWFIPEEKRTGHQLYIKSEKVPISKLKFVKDSFGVSFTSTILSSFGAGIADFNKSKGFSNHIKNMPFASPLPLKNHPKKLRNHSTAAFYGVSIDQTLSPLERLRNSEKHYQNAKMSTYPYLAPFGMNLAAAQLPIVSRFLLTNRTLSSFMTNFPGPGVRISTLGGEIIEMDFVAGLVMGVAGVIFTVLSYYDHIRISLVAENAALERHELQELVKAISDEIDNLYRLAQQDKDVKIFITDDEQEQE